MIGHTILVDFNMFEFRILAIVGMIVFYISKQTAYIIIVTEYRYYNIRNTITVLSIAGVSLLLPSPKTILIGMCFSLMVYIVMNYRAQIKLY